MRFGTTGRALATISAFTLLAGCSEGNLNSIYRKSTLGGADVVLVDAKQRMIVGIPVSSESRHGEIKPTHVVCAEPSPDVAQALSSALTASLKVAVEGRGSGQAAFGHSAAESVSQLGERLGTIQLLRDVLYRACEAYANGAMTRTMYAVALSGIDDTMVTMLSSELTAGAFGRQLAAITTQASVGGAASKELIDKLKADVGKSKAALTKAVEDRKAQEETLAEAKKATPKDDKKIKDAEKELNDRKKAEGEAAKNYQKAVEKLTLASFGAARALAGFGTAVAGGQILNRSGNGTSSGSKGRFDALDSIHKRFIRQGQGQSSLLIACITSLDTPPPSGIVGQQNVTALVQDVAYWEREVGKLRMSGARRGTAELTRAERQLRQARTKLTAVAPAMTPFGVLCAKRILPTLFKAAEESAKRDHIYRMAKLAVKKSCCEKSESCCDKIKAKTKTLAEQIKALQALVKSAEAAAKMAKEAAETVKKKTP
jgi:hypothetical protein